jgi:OsmC-like protein
MTAVTVQHHGGDRFGIQVRGHEVTVDQPTAYGGTDAGPTPTELFVAGLAGCVAFYARRYLARHGLPESGLTVTAEYTMATRPARVDTCASPCSFQRTCLPNGATHCSRWSAIAPSTTALPHPRRSPSASTPPCLCISSQPGRCDALGRLRRPAGWSCG